MKNVFLCGYIIHPFIWRKILGTRNSNLNFSVNIIIYELFFRRLDWVAQTLVKFTCQLKLNWHLNLHEMYIELIYTYGLIET